MRRKILVGLAVLIAMILVGLGTKFAVHHINSPKLDEETELSVAAQSDSKTDYVSVAESTSPLLGKDIPGLPEYCADKLISVSGCDGMTEITTDQGNTYQLVEIGDQCWFAQNLEAKTTRWQSQFGYDKENAIFTWERAMHDSSPGTQKDSCPPGWHIPSECEFRYFGMEGFGYYSLGTLNGDNIKNLETGFVWKRDTRTRMFWTSTLLPCPGQKSCPLAVAIGKENLGKIDFTPIGHPETAMPIRCLRT